jgi:hypothetical protein
MGGDEAGGVALGQGFDGAEFGEHAALSGEQCVDPGAQPRPFVLGQVELATEVEQGDLADLLAGAFGGDQTEGEVGFVARFIPGYGFADEHAGQDGCRGGWRQDGFTILWHYIQGLKKEYAKSVSYQYSLRSIVVATLKMG